MPLMFLQFQCSVNGTFKIGIGAVAQLGTDWWEPGAYKNGDPGEDLYERRYRERVLKQLHRRAAEFGFTLQ
jgi:hypothetical protein